jgi:hypothetical protein
MQTKITIMKYNIDDISPGDRRQPQQAFRFTNPVNYEDEYQ